jgi:hypothetical protein
MTIFGVLLSFALSGIFGFDKLASLFSDTNPDTNAEPPIVSTSQPSEDVHTTIEILVYDSETRKSLPNIDVELILTRGVPVQDKTDERGYVLLTFPKQEEKRLIVNFIKNGEKISTQYINTSIGQTHKIYINQREEISSKKDITLNDSSDKQFATKKPGVLTKIPSISGYWNVQLDVSDYTSNQERKLSKKKYDLVAYLQQNNNKITGYLSEGSGSACKGKDETKISGLVKGKSINWDVSYLGECCRDGAMSFSGEFVESTGDIIGKIKPSGESTSKRVCTLLWADVSMKKKGGYF